MESCKLPSRKGSRVRSSSSTRGGFRSTYLLFNNIDESHDITDTLLDMGAVCYHNSGRSHNVAHLEKIAFTQDSRACQRVINTGMDERLLQRD